MWSASNNPRGEKTHERVRSIGKHFGRDSDAGEVSVSVLFQGAHIPYNLYTCGVSTVLCTNRKGNDTEGVPGRLSFCVSGVFFGVDNGERVYAEDACAECRDSVEFREGSAVEVVGGVGG